MTGRADAIVVGGGPAGAATALGLARRGRRVVLLDRAAFPRPKACGDCLSPEATRALERLRVLDAVEAASPARLRGWSIHAPGGVSFGGTFATASGGDARVETSIAIERARLDRVLLEAAVDAGVDVRTGVRVEDFEIAPDRSGRVVTRSERGRERLAARIVVGADGLRSIVARRAGATAAPGPRRKVSFTLHPRLPASFMADRGEMHVVDAGCVGIAPVDTGDVRACNVTVVVDTALAAVASRDPLALIEAMVARAPGLAARRRVLVRALRDAGRPLASGPFDRPTRFVVADALALVGDAAGYYDPFTGQGVCHALLQAEDLVGVADAALEREGPVRGRALAPYARRLRAGRRAALLVQRAVDAVVTRPGLMDRLAPALERAPRFTDALVGVTGDILPVRALFGPPALELAGAMLPGGRRP